MDQLLKKNFFLQRILPKCYARAKAASLPDGSIRPQRSYSTVRTSPVYKSAVVPLMSLAMFETLTSVVNIFMLQHRQVYKTTCAVIILVKLAISRLFVDLLPSMKHIFLLSYIDQHFEVSLGSFSFPGYCLDHAIFLVDFFLSIFVFLVR